MKKYLRGIKVYFNYLLASLILPLSCSFPIHREVKDEERAELFYRLRLHRQGRRERGRVQRHHQQGQPGVDGGGRVGVVVLAQVVAVRRERDLVSLLGAGSLQLHTGVWECREGGRVLAGVVGHTARNGTQVPACNWGHQGRPDHGEEGGCSTSRGTTG